MGDNKMEEDQFEDSFEEDFNFNEQEEDPGSSQPPPKKPNPKVLMGVILSVFLLIGYTGWKFFGKSKTSETIAQETSQTLASTTSTTTPTLPTSPITDTEKSKTTAAPLTPPAPPPIATSTPTTPVTPAPITATDIAKGFEETPKSSSEGSVTLSELQKALGTPDQNTQTQKSSTTPEAAATTPATTTPASTTSTSTTPTPPTPSSITTPSSTTPITTQTPVPTVSGSTTPITAPVTVPTTAPSPTPVAPNPEGAQIGQAMKMLDKLNKQMEYTVTQLKQLDAYTHEISDTITKLNSDIGSIDNRISALTNTTSLLSKDLGSIKTEVGQFKRINQDDRMAQKERIEAEYELEEQPAHYKKKRPAAVYPEEAEYSVHAVIPGRAWLKTSKGQIITVTEGETLGNYGKVLVIDAANGVVLTNSGVTFR